FPVTGVSSSYTLYDDDRTSPSALESGQFRLINFEATDGGTRIVADAKGSYPGASKTLQLNFVINRVASPGARIRVNGRFVRAAYDPYGKTLTFSLRWPVDRQLVIETINMEICK
ncbi:MAG: DUF5110 domain-containing protein, partial [Muribaculaceae bacterium]|nr:DUF5110 domain-containing protein [Muribaculaceae bacterium]